MNQQANSFPMFFTLERVENGYILTTSTQADGMTQQTKYRKEVVTNDKIDSRIGHLLCLDTLAKEYPVVFHIEAIGEKTYKVEDIPDRENLMVAKLAFAHFQSQKLPPESIVVLQLEDSSSIEIYGRDAERIAESNSFAIVRKGGIPLLSFPNNKDGLRTMASFVRNPALVKVTEKQIMEWYSSHRVELEKPSPPSSSTNTKLTKK